MIDIIHRVGIKAPISKVYKALSTIDGISGWWTQDTSGTSSVGKSIEVRFHAKGKKVGQMKMLVEILETNKKVHWHFTEGPEEWIGTDAIFNIHEEEDYTIVLFGHRNWREAIEFTAHCSTRWAVFLLSLKELIETGKGKPAPDDLKTDNWL